MKLGLLAIAVLSLGCHSAETVTKPPPNQAAKDLTAKLKQMSPAERTQYLKQHPEEAMAAMGGAGIAPRPPAPR